jgi:isocitrate lyase
MGELCFSGWKITKAEADPVYQQYFDAFQYRVRVDAVVHRMLKAYEMRGNNEYRSRARDGALAYDADKVTEKYWKPILADIEARMFEVKSE